MSRAHRSEAGPFRRVLVDRLFVKEKQKKFHLLCALLASVHRPIFIFHPSLSLCSYLCFPYKIIFTPVVLCLRSCAMDATNCYSDGTIFDASNRSRPSGTHRRSERTSTPIHGVLLLHQRTAEERVPEGGLYGQRSLDAVSNASGVQEMFGRCMHE